MYSSIMAVIAAPIRSSSPAIGVLMVIVLIAALAAAAYFIGRMYVNRRLNRRN
jgi:hypothetical protein